MSEVRALARDIFIYDLQDFDTLLGALVLTAGMTNANLYAIVNIIIDVSPPPGHFILQDDNGETAAKDTQPLLPGAYFSWPMVPSSKLPMPPKFEYLGRERGCKRLRIKYESEMDVVL